ncbi:MAG: 4-(cytidine 5'-diphospho)-2-C-methyl-D-erythritol kinase [Ferruginibacter sp.]
MVVFPHCKINIGLQVLGKRPDGYHNIQTVFYPLAVYDVLEIIEASPGNYHFSFRSSGLPITAPATKNICVKAYEAFKAKCKQLPEIHMHLHKAIPIGAGLGGGSADAAFVLKLLNEKFYAGLSEDEISNIAETLGSDCVFFTQNLPCFAEGRGEMLSPVSLDLSAFKILLVYPAIHINTAIAFKEIKPNKNPVDIKSAMNLPVTDWKNIISNDFEKTIFPRYPILAEIKNNLYKSGAIYASMSGSGSTLYGIFKKDSHPVFNFPADYFYKWI